MKAASPPLAEEDVCVGSRVHQHRAPPTEHQREQASGLALLSTTHFPPLSGLRDAPRWQNSSSNRPSVRNAGGASMTMGETLPRWPAAKRGTGHDPLEGRVTRRARSSATRDDAERHGKLPLLDDVPVAYGRYAASFVPSACLSAARCRAWRSWHGSARPAGVRTRFQRRDSSSGGGPGDEGRRGDVAGNGPAASPDETEEEN
mmetsp:Transcript_29918/g.55010  ORF Transcript_29918/g.55010 Transcript_29918/m.55010 type:complete len:203 (-) Transcript_29918:358-966(-)